MAEVDPVTGREQEPASTAARLLLDGALALAVGLCLLLTALFGCTEPPQDSNAAARTPQHVVKTAELPSRALRLGRPPHLANAAQEYAPFVRHLAEEIDHPIELVVPSSYDGVIEGLANGDLDLGLLTPLAYVRTKKRLSELRLLAMLLGEGAAKYRGYVVTRADAPFRSLKELRGRQMAFVDPSSTSGYLFPKALLLEQGLEAPGDFKKIWFAGSHSAVVHAVIEGRADAGAISSTTFRHMRAESISGKLRILAKTEWIPFDAFVAHPSLPRQLAERLRQIVLDLNLQSAEGRRVLTGTTTTNGFVPASDSDYDPVRRVQAKLNGGGD